MTRVKGYELICPICKGESFTKKYSLLNSRGMTFLGLDWLNQSAINYICDSCGYIFWFIDDGSDFCNEKILEKNMSEQENYTIDYETSKAEEDECPICFSHYDKNQTKCVNCGHIFK